MTDLFPSITKLRFKAQHTTFEATERVFGSTATSCCGSRPDGLERSATGNAEEDGKNHTTHGVLTDKNLLRNIKLIETRGTD